MSTPIFYPPQPGYNYPSYPNPNGTVFQQPYPQQQPTVIYQQQPQQQSSSCCGDLCGCCQCCLMCCACTYLATCFSEMCCSMLD